MYKIRMARQEDWSDLLAMSKQFYSTTDYAGMIEFHLPSAAEQFKEMLRTGGVVMAFSNERLIGMLGFMTTPFPINRTVIVGTEIMWWMDPSYRGSRIAVELIETAETYAKLVYGCKFFSMSKLNNSPERIGQFYEKRGYKAQDTSYMKEL